MLLRLGKLGVRAPLDAKVADYDILCVASLGLQAER